MDTADRRESTAELDGNGTPAERSCALATERDVAAALCVDTKTLQKWRSAGTGPPWISLGYRSVRYRWSEVAGWLDEQQARSTSR